jgi:hypothetical protein
MFLNKLDKPQRTLLSPVLSFCSSNYLARGCVEQHWDKTFPVQVKVMLPLLN